MDAADGPRQPERRVISFSNSGNPVRQQHEVRLKGLYIASFQGWVPAATVATSPRNAMIAAEPEFRRNQHFLRRLSRRYLQQRRPRCLTRTRTRASRIRTRVRSPASSRAADRSRDSSSRIPAVRARSPTRDRRPSASSELASARAGRSRRKAGPFFLDFWEGALQRSLRRLSPPGLTRGSIALPQDSFEA